MHCLEMLCMHQKTCEFIPVELKPEEHSASDIIDTALHGPVHGFGMPGIIMLGTRGVELFVALLVLCDILIHFFTLPTSWTWVILSLMAGFFLFFTFSMRFLYTSNERAMILSFLPSFVRRVLHH